MWKVGVVWLNYYGMDQILGDDLSFEVRGTRWLATRGSEQKAIQCDTGERVLFLEQEYVSAYL